jgi:hypothetical protein
MSWRAWTAQEDATARQMRREGRSKREIARVLGRRLSSVCDRLNGKPSPAPPRVVPDEVRAEHAHRAALAPRDLTAAICGDPLPGYSALDKRRGAP